MGEGKRGKPANDLERLRIFEHLAAEYFRMLELFHADNEGPVPPDSIEGERRRWLELFRAALLRKFIVRDEHVSLKLVLRAIRRCNYSLDPRLVEGAEAVAGLFTAEMLHDRQAAAPDPHQDVQDIFEDVLYGRLLHGDADRFHRSGWAEDYRRLSTVAASRFEAEHALRKALEVVSYGLANGLLRSPDFPADDAGAPAAGM